MLLTLADGQGTGDENWSDWKETLVWQLYRNTSLYLADGEAFYRQRGHRARSASRRRVARSSRRLSPTKSTRISSSCPIAISRPIRVAEIVEHIRLFRSFLEVRARSGGRRARARPSTGSRIRTAATPSSGSAAGIARELLARIAGVPLRRAI